MYFSFSFLQPTYLTGCSLPHHASSTKLLHERRARNAVAVAVAPALQSQPSRSRHNRRTTRFTIAIVPRTLRSQSQSQSSSHSRHNCSGRIAVAFVDTIALRSSNQIRESFPLAKAVASQFHLKWRLHYCCNRGTLNDIAVKISVTPEPQSRATTNTQSSNRSRVQVVGSPLTILTASQLHFLILLQEQGQWHQNQTTATTATLTVGSQLAMVTKTLTYQVHQLIRLPELPSY